MFMSINEPRTTEIYTLSLHDALPILKKLEAAAGLARSLPFEVNVWRSQNNFYQMLHKICPAWLERALANDRSEEHTSEPQSRFDLVCRLLLEKKKHICLQPYLDISSS